jgi:dienelactone hydrolase
MVPKSLFALSILILSLAAAPLSGQAPSPDAAKPAASAASPAAQNVPSPPASANTTSKPAQMKEDWSVLPLEKSGLNPSRLNVVRLAKWDRGDATEELLRAEWRPNDPIDLYVVHPKGVEKPPAILYLYGYSNETERFRDEGWCKRVTEGGFAAVGFLSAVSGDRVHMPRPMKEWFVSELQESLGVSTHDVQMILNYLAMRGDIDMTRIGMFGQGSGASVAVLAAAADPRIKTIDLFDPWGDWPDWLKESPVVPEKERPDYLKPEFLAKVAKLDPVLYLPQLTSQNVRIEYILDDQSTPKSAREAMLAAAPKNADIVRYQDTADHVKAYHVNGLSGWIKAQLQTGPSLTPLQPKSGPVAAGVADSRP